MSSVCPRCGERLKVGPDLRHLMCPSCGIEGDRNRMAWVNVAEPEDGGLRFGRVVGNDCDPTSCAAPDRATEPVTVE